MSGDPRSVRWQVVICNNAFAMWVGSCRGVCAGRAHYLSRYPFQLISPPCRAARPQAFMLNRLAPWSLEVVSTSYGLWVQGSPEATGDHDVLLGTVVPMAYELRLRRCIPLPTLPPGHVVLTVGAFWPA
jgi:hypothetical protein